MRYSKLLYYSVLEEGKFSNIGNLLFEVDGVFVDIESLPDSYLKQYYGFSKEELFEMISSEIDWE